MREDRKEDFDSEINGRKCKIILPNGIEVSGRVYCSRYWIKVVGDSTVYVNKNNILTIEPI
ncbi:MAG: hypothetical protein QXJ48_02285 [Candidatus Korarchaeum sp.]